MAGIELSNQAVARLLREVAAIYEIKGDDRFRIRAYQNAAASVEHATEEVKDLWEEGKLKELSGIGSAIEAHLDELFRKGKVRHFEAVKKGLPAAMFRLLDVPGIGAKTAFTLAKRLRLRERSATADLLAAAKKGKIRSLEGFGEVSEKEILENLEKERKSENRMVLPVAAELAKKLLIYLSQNPKVLRADSLGSLRRRVATIGDIDIAVSTGDPRSVVEHFTHYPEGAEVLNEGDIKGRIILKNGRQVDLMTEKPGAYGSLLQHFTGSKNHNIHLRELAKTKGLSLSEHGIKNKSGKIQAVADETDFYSRLGLPYIEPELREDWGEIETGVKGELPRLVELADIKGDLQMHTVWSDGQNTLEEMVKAAAQKGYQYIAITDHQQSLEEKGKRKILAEIRRRANIIDHIMYSYGNIRVLNGIEIIVKTDGEMAYPDEILKEFDYVLAAVHTGFSQKREVNTRRIVNALKNPYVKAFAHPTCRLLGSRDGIDADWEEIFRTASEEGKFLEINSFPERLDLPDILVKTAKSYGVKFAVNTDAHATAHLDLMEYGISVARRGWLTKDDVVNTLPKDRLLKLLRVKEDR